MNLDYEVANSSSSSSDSEDDDDGDAHQDRLAMRSMKDRKANMDEKKSARNARDRSRRAAKRRSVSFLAFFFKLPKLNTFSCL